jgi:DNA-binding NarL/FixJ family response regulator
VLITSTRLGDLLLLRAKVISPLAKLSKRERAVVQLYAKGNSYKEVARSLQLAPTTIRNFIQHAYRKLGIDNKTALANLLQREQ